MSLTDNKQHWENVYQTKSPEQVSWTQKIPSVSLEMIHSLNLPKDVSVIDIGGGDSLLVDFLLDEGYTNITVLDISEHALERAKRRLGDKAELINWVVSDITNYQPDRKFDLWHDRATFHFLTSDEQIEAYLNLTCKYVNGHMIIATFSENGPLKCSGLEIKQYSVSSLSEQFSSCFDKISCKNADHITPFETVQNFTFCAFKRKS